MEETTKTVKQSSVVDKNVEPIEKDQFVLPTVYALGALIVAFLVLKLFVYIKDDKRHGK